MFYVTPKDITARGQRMWKYFFTKTFSPQRELLLLLLLFLFLLLLLLLTMQTKIKLF